MKNKNLALLTGMIAICATLIISACNKKFDEPPVQNTTLSQMGIVANRTIDQLKVSSYVGSGGFFPIEDSIVITGVVTANDKSGNFYKQIYIQDSTGAIEVDIEGTGLYNTFPVGREVAVFCKGLYVANVTGMQKICTRTIQNGAPSILGIPITLSSKYIRTGAIGQAVEPQVVTLSQLTQKMQGSLVKLENFQVPRPDVLFSTWSDSSANKNTVNVNIENCSNERTIIRTSAYSNFAALPVPKGNGSVTAIYTVFNSTKQFVIRDTSDVQFNNLRCDNSLPGPLVKKTIQEIRGYGATGDVIPANTIIEGTIVSNTANEAAGNYRIEDESGYGIQIRFTTAGNKGFTLGDKLRVFVEGLAVAPFNGDLQINNVPGAVPLGRGNVTPRQTTVQDIVANANDWASTVVTINNVTITNTGASGPGVNYSLTDPTGTIVSFVRNSLGYTLPANASSVTGYVSLFNGTAQLTLRQPADVK